MKGMIEMKYSIKAKNIQVTEAIEKYIETRMSSLDKFFVIDEQTIAKILIRIYRDEQRIEVTIPTKFGILRAEANEKDLYSSIDDVVEKIESQIRKQKTKIKGRRTKEKLGHAFDLDYLQELGVDNQEDEGNGVVRIKELTPEPKDIDTAILEMEMLNHSFYIFRDMETENINVLYKRKDGGYGLIETN